MYRYKYGSNISMDEYMEQCMNYSIRRNICMNYVEEFNI